jgi:dipeptidyl aminopeptidase/acylaminoacyl peptidase
MRQTGFRRLTLVLMLPVLMSAAAASKKDRPGERMNTTLSPNAVMRWLSLGPALEPLPAFGSEKPGSYGTEDLLRAARAPRNDGDVADGAEAPWFADGTHRWTQREAGADGMVRLTAPPGTGKQRPAVAWLATYVSVSRWQKVEVELRGDRPRRFWLDGEAVAMGGTEPASDKPAEVKATLKLSTGKHLLVVATLLDAEGGEGWSVGLFIADPKEGRRPELSFTVDPERDVDIPDILDAPQVTALAVSPEGEQVAVTLSRILPGTDDAETWIELRGVSDGRLLGTWRGSPEPSQLAWDPSGRYLSYVTRTKSDPERSTLWVADRAAKSVEPLLERIENFESYAWAPNGSGVVCTISVKPDPDKRGIKRLEGLLDRQKDYRAKRQLHWIPVRGKRGRRLTAGSLGASLQAFSPDGGRLVFLREVEDVSSRPFSRKEIWELDLVTGETRKIRDGWWIESVQYAPDGRRLLIQAGPSEFGSAGVNVPEGMIPNEGDGQLFIYDPPTSQAEPITRDFNPAVASAFWSRHDGRIYVKAEDHDRVEVFVYDPETRKFAPISAGLDVLQEVSFAERAAVGVVSGSSPWRPEEVVAIELSRGTARELLKPAEEWYARVRRGQVTPWSFTTASGKVIDGRVYLPPGFDSAKDGKIPAIVYYYGGTSPVGRDYGGRYPKEWWAANGYAVYVLQPSGATGYGQAFSAFHVNDWGEITSAEIIEGTRKFLDAHPFVDPKRVGCIGASFGGFMTELIVTKTDLFAAAVSHAGISSISSYWGEGYWGYSYSAQATAGSFPWNRKDIYVDRSPLFHADKVKTPLLLTHGASDTNVPVGESESFYTALKLVGAPVEYLQVEGMDHTIADHAKRIVWSRSVVAWFDRWLKGQPEWWEELYP